MTLWDHIPPEELRTMNGFSDHRNVYDIQRIAAVKMIERRLTNREYEDNDELNALLDRLDGLRELLRTGPHS